MTISLLILLVFCQDTIHAFERELTGLTPPLGTIVGSIQGLQPHQIAYSSTENIAYVADSVIGLVIINVTIIASPQIIQTVPINSEAIAVSLSQDGNTIYCRSITQIFIINVTNSLAPNILSTTWAPGGSSISISDDNVTLYSTNSRGFMIINATNKESPQVLSWGEVIYSGVAISSDESKVYLATSGQLLIMDVTTPTYPTQIGSYNIDQFAGKLVLSPSGSIVAIAEQYLRIYNVATPSAVTLLGSAQVEGIYGLVMSSTGNTLYAACGLQGVVVVDITVPTSPAILATISTGTTYAIAVHSNVMYATDTLHVKVYDISNLQSPTQIAFILVADDVRALKLNAAGTILFLADISASCIYQINVQTPSAPVSTSYRCWQPSISLGPVDLVLSASETYLFYQFGFQGFYVYPVPLGDTSGNIGFNPYFNNALTGVLSPTKNLVYVADSNGGLKVVSISNVTNPAVINTGIVNYNQIVTSPNSYVLYIADIGGGLRILNRVNPAYYPVVGSVTSISIQSLALSSNGNYIYAVGSSLYVIHVATITSPTVLFTTALPSTGYISISPDNNNVYISCGSAGFLIFDVSNTAIAPVQKYNSNTIVSNSGFTVIAPSCNTAYVADGTVLRVLDITNRAVPVQLNYYNYGTGMTISEMSISASGNYLYVAYSTYLVIMNIASITVAPTVSGSSFNFGVQIQSITPPNPQDGSFLFVGGIGGYVWKIEIWAGSPSIFYGSQMLPSTYPGINSLKMSYNTEFLHYLEGYLGMSTLSLVGNWYVIKRAAPSYQAIGLYPNQKNIFCLDSNGPSEIWNIQNPLAPVLTGYWASGGAAIAFNGNTAFAIGTNQLLMVLDVTYPIPIQITFFNFGDSLSMAPYQNYGFLQDVLFIAAGTSGIVAVNITSFAIISTLTSVFNAQYIVLSPNGETAFISDGAGFFKIASLVNGETKSNNFGSTIVQVEYSWAMPTSCAINTNGNILWLLDFYYRIIGNQVNTATGSLTFDNTYFNMGGSTYLGLTKIIYSPLRNALFATALGEGFYIFSVTNVNANPIFLAQVSTFNAEMMVLSAIGDIAFVADLIEGLMIYNVTILTDPVLISILPTVKANCVDLSTNGEAIFLADGAGGFKVINITSLTEPTLISHFITSNAVWVRTLPNSLSVFLIDAVIGVIQFNVANYNNVYIVATTPIIAGNFATFSPDFKTIFVTYSQSKYGNGYYVSTQEGLAIFDISNPSKITLTNIVPAPTNCFPNSVTISPNGGFAYVPAGIWGSPCMFVVSLAQRYALTIQQNMTLGNIYHNNLVLLVLNSEGNYYNRDTIPNKFVSATFYSTSQLSSTKSQIVLPTWIQVDLVGGTLTCSPNSATNIENYFIEITATFQIPTNLFIGIGPINSTTSPELALQLLSDGYLDFEYYPTSVYNPEVPLSLNSEFSPYEIQIRGAIANYYQTIISKLNVNTSLIITTTKTINIETASVIVMTVDIILDSNNTEFIPVSYKALTTITNQQTKIALTGLLFDISSTLEALRINIEGNQESNGTIIVNDGLNPINTTNFTNITQYFQINQGPYVNNSIQNQLPTIQTGAEFDLKLASNTFIDPEGDTLTYQIFSSDGSVPPSWISMHNTDISGIPPDQFFYSASLMVMASDGYKNATNTFTITVQPSFNFIMATVLQYIGPVIAAIGAIVYYNELCNILFKKKYRHTKIFSVKSSHEISDEMIHPFAFGQSEMIQSKQVLTKMKRYAAKFIGGSSLLNFVSENGVINFDKVGDIMKTVNAQPPAKVYPNSVIPPTNPPVSLSGINEDILKQSIISELEEEQLRTIAEKNTKIAFEKLKDNWDILVESKDNGTSSFLRINEPNFQTAVRDVGIHDYDPDQYEHAMQLPKTNLEHLLSFFKQSPVKEQGSPDPIPASPIRKRLFSPMSTGVRVTDLNSAENSDSSNLIKNEDSSSKKVLDFFRNSPIPVKSSPLSGVTSPSKDQEALRKQSNSKNFRHKETQINVVLLKRALISYAYKNNTVNISPSNCNIISKQRMPGQGCLYAIQDATTLNLRTLEYLGKGKIGFGIKYKIVDKMLHFYGNAHEDFHGQTLCVQILNKKGRILKEIWINGDTDE